MTRISYKLKLKPNSASEYIRRHREVWPELIDALKEAGVTDFSIFFDDETDTLFAVQELSENNSRDQLREKAIVQKWWAFMADLMEVNPDLSPKSKPLPEVFRME